MAAQFYKINYKSDFVLTINSDAGWAVPFCIKFWTGMPSHGYFAGFDGENYVNCRVGETPTQLLVMFDDHHMPVGPLRMQIAYHTTIEEFPDRKFDEVTNPTNVTVDIDGTEYQVMLDFTGETGAEIDFSMPSSGVMSVNGKIGYVTLNAEDVGAQPTIEDLSTIRSGAAAGATAVQPAEMTAALATKQDTIPDLATIRSGAAAGATAVQPAALQEGLAMKQDVISDLATIRSGAAAGATAVQPAALTPIQTVLQTIEAVIPSAASSQNQLADKNFVNSSISTNTANFVGTYNSLAELQAVQNPTNNDYGFVIETDAQGNEYYDRYKYVAASQQWLFEYKVESTPFTANQWAAIQSGITSALVTKLNALPTNAELQQTLDGKADTSDIPTALSQLSQDSTHRVVTDSEKSTWNGKQNAIDDLATIRSGAAAGATAVQPAAMNTALAAKQDTLTFDNTPTANSSNPVKSSGIKTALDAKQSTISTVNVTVDNNTGTPSGSASVSGSTLSLSFQNLKGATGATGATGPQGPQGERGLPGESGVTGDVSGFTVIQTIDPSATYGATDIAGAATVQATNQELTELAGLSVEVADVDLSNFKKGGYINLSGSTASLTPTADSTWEHIVYPCKSYDKFILTTLGGISPRAYGFLDSELNVIKVAAASTYGENFLTTAPPNAAYFIANGSNNGNLRLSAVAKKRHNISVIDGLAEEVFNSATGLFERGSIDLSNYAEVESTGRLRNSEPVNILDGATITLNVPFSFAYGYRVFLYNNGVANSYIDRNTSGYSFTGNQTIPIPSSSAYNQFRIVIFPKSDHTFTGSEASGTTVSVVGASLAQRIEGCENILTVDGDEKFAFQQQQASSSSTSYITPTSSAIDSSYTFTIKATGGTTGRYGYISLPSLTEGKKYRLSFNYVNALGTNATVSFRDSSKNIIVALGSLEYGASGNFSYEFTHDGNISYIGFAFLQVAKNNYLKISNVSLIELDTLQDKIIELEEDVADTGVIDVDFNLSSLYFSTGNISGTTGGDITETNVIRTTGWLKMNGGTVITYSLASGYRLGFVYYSSKSTNGYITCQEWLTDAGTVTVPDTANYVRIVIASPSGSSATPSFNDVNLALSLSKKIEEADFAAKYIDDLTGINEVEWEQGAIESPTGDEIPHTGRIRTVNVYKVGKNFYAGVASGWRLAVIYYDKFGNYVNATWFFTGSLFVQQSEEYYVRFVFAKSDYSDISIASFDKSNVMVPLPKYTAHTIVDRLITDFDADNTTVAGIYNHLHDVAVKHSNYITENILGNDASGDYELRSYTLGNGSKKIFVVVGQHGPQSDPWDSVVTATRFITQLADTTYNSDFAEHLRDEYTLCIVPCANPYGLEHFNALISDQTSSPGGRYNYNAVNLNRDWGTFSQPETQLIKAKMDAIQPDAIIDLHTTGDYLTGSDSIKGKQWTEYTESDMLTMLNALSAKQLQLYNVTLSHNLTTTPSTKLSVWGHSYCEHSMTAECNWWVNGQSEPHSSQIESANMSLLINCIKIMAATIESISYVYERVPKQMQAT